MIRVVHVKRDSFDTYIGRANGALPRSKWANPYTIGRDGTRDEVIAQYEANLRANPALMAQLPELRGKVLGCWCKGTAAGDVPCHGDVLARLVAELDKPAPLLPIFTSHYSYAQSTLTLEEAGKTRPGNAASIVDLAREHHFPRVVLVDETIDGFLEAHKALSKPFKPTPPPKLEDLLKDVDKDGKPKLKPEKAQQLVDEATAKFARESQWSTDPIALVYGLKMTVVPDMANKKPESALNESSIIVFLRNTQGYTDLLKLHNAATTTGAFDGYGRVDWATLKRLWTPNFSLALPFFSSFLSRNLLTMASIVPDLPALPTVFREIESDLPFAPLIDKAIDQYVASTGALVQPVKSVYYRDSQSFDSYVTFRARSTKSKGKIGTFSDPGVDNLCSDRFSLQCWRELA